MGNFSNYWDLTTLFTKLKNKLKSISDKIDDSVSLKTATGNPITLTDAANANAEELSMTIEPIQSGSGYPSPTNVRPISGLTSGEVQTTNGTDTNTATITFGQTVYGGRVNFKSGIVTLTHKLTTVGALTWNTQVSAYANFMSESLSAEIKRSDDDVVVKSDIYQSTYNSKPSPVPYCVYSNLRGFIKINDRRYSTVEEWLAVCSSTQICYELETPTTLTLTPAELELLKGNNTITANGAEISIKYYPDNAIGALAGRVDNIPDKLSDLTDDATHRTVSDTEKSTWNGKLNKSGGTMTGDIVLGDNDESEATSIYPLRNGNGSVGTASRAFEEGHFGTLYVNGDDVENLLDEKANESDVTTALAGKVDTPVVYSDNSSPFMLFASGGGSPIGYFSNNTRYIKGGADENGTPYIQLWKAGYDSVRLSNTKALFKVYNHQLEFGIDGIVGSGNGGNYTVNLSQTKLAYLNNITSDVQEQIANRVEIQNNAGFHNSIYRGKNLGTEVTQEQWNAISAGTFDDMYIGDYWTIGGVNYRIAAFDYWLHCGDTECTTHHVVLVPDTNLDAQKMNDSNVTAGGYVGSKMYTSYITTARNKVISAFGSANILSHRQLFSNAVDGNYASNWAWYDSTIDLMSESMVYGAPIGGKAKVDSTNFNIGIDKVQLPLFALDPSRITNRADWWLRDVVAAAAFALVDCGGHASARSASTSHGVRPAFGIKA